jgi:hypothetical protein
MLTYHPRAVLRAHPFPNLYPPGEDAVTTLSECKDDAIEAEFRSAVVAAYYDELERRFGGNTLVN